MRWKQDVQDTGCSLKGPDGEEPTQALVAIDSLGGHQMHLKLHKRDGFEAEDVLGGDASDETEGVLGSLGAATQPHHIHVPWHPVISACTGGRSAILAMHA